MITLCQGYKPKWDFFCKPLIKNNEFSLGFITLISYGYLIILVNKVHFMSNFLK